MFNDLENFQNVFIVSIDIFNRKFQLVSTGESTAGLRTALIIKKQFLLCYDYDKHYIRIVLELVLSCC